MKARIIRITAALLAGLCLGVVAQAADTQKPVKIGMVTTLSTGAGYLGQDVRDGFMLAVKQGNGKLGGVPVEVLVADDGRDPAQARQIVTRMMQSEGVDLMTGVIFSNVALATVPEVTRNGMIYISPNAGPSKLAGAMCNKNYFNVAWQNDNLPAAMGKYVDEQGYDDVYLLAPNYPAGKDEIAGFKRYYDGKVAGVNYTRLGQTDYASAISAIRAADPDAVFFFYPGGMGINFVKQYVQSGLIDDIPLFGPAFSFDNTLVDAIGDAALGIHNTAQWSKDLDNPANQEFVQAYEAMYNREPTLYSSQGYDDARLIGSALKAVDGNVDDIDAFRKALEAANFKSVRGDFKFAANHHPIQDFYVRKVVKDDNGNYTNVIIGKVFDNHKGAYGDQCPL